MAPTSAEQNPWQQRSRKEIFSNRFITLFVDDVLRPDGEPAEYSVVHFKNRAVGVVALNDKGQVLMVGQWRYPLNEYSWEIPEGGGPLEEAPEDTARRELQEETGYRCDNLQLLARAHLSNSVSDEEALVFLATGLHPGESNPEGTEQLQVAWRPFEEALAMVLDGRITDSMSVIGLQRLALLKVFADNES